MYSKHCCNQLQPQAKEIHSNYAPSEEKARGSNPLCSTKIGKSRKVVIYADLRDFLLLGGISNIIKTIRILVLLFEIYYIKFRIWKCLQPICNRATKMQPRKPRRKIGGVTSFHDPIAIYFFLRAIPNIIYCTLDR